MKNVIIAIVALVFGSCAHAWEGQYQGSTYDGSQVMQAQSARIGTVEDIRRVQIVNNNSNGTTAYTGSAVGASVGGLIGSNIGNGNGRTAATVIAAAIGGMTGYAAGNAIARERFDAAEITVSFKDGSAIVVTQAIDGDVAAMRPGNRVRVIGGGWGGGNTRVARVGNYQ